MNLLDRLERIKYVDYLILSKTANSIRDLSARLKTSERQVHNVIKEMREMGAPLKYDRREKRFYYEEDKKFTFKYE